MFGWEFPPFNSGGLGVACKGLTKGLVNQGVELIFVLPKIHGVLEDEYMRILSAEGYEQCSKIKFRAIDSILKPYISSKTYSIELSGLEAFAKEAANIYGSDLFSEVRRYAIYAKGIALQEDYDIIHCHDWLTYQAGIAAKHIAKLRGMNVPLIVQVHATEFDRTAGHPNQYVYDIERQGMHEADYVITVSEYTKNMVIRHYGVSPEKVFVVHNAIDISECTEVDESPKLKQHYKTVLFLGRITIQKGPDHFLRIAKRIAEKDDNVRFIMVGSGDMFTRIVEEAAKMGIGDKVLFSDFLSGKDVARAYKMADVYVMSSVSEPFGLTALEAARNGVPVVVSKQAGVTEVLKNCLVADFWDVDLMATKILAILHNPEFKKHIAEEVKREISGFSWDKPARQCIEVYLKALGGK